MIKSNELRCGNTLHYLTAEGDVLPTTIDWQDIQWISENEKDFNTVHRPIPLTEDWLKRFGFGRLGKYSFRTKHLIIHHRKRGFVINKKIREIQYVHELQNIYWALFNTELTPSDGGKIE